MINNEVEMSDQRVLVTLKGDFEGWNAAEARDALIKCLDAGQRNLVIDLSHIQKMNATGLGVLVSIQQRIGQRGGRMTLHGLNDTTRRLFERTRLIRTFCVEESDLEC